MDDLSSLLTGENAALIGAIVALLSTVKAVWPSLFTKPMVMRFLPLMPIVLGVAAVFIGFGDAGYAISEWQSKLLLGCLVGFTSGQLYKAGRTSIFGWGLKGPQEAPADLSEDPTPEDPAPEEPVPAPVLSKTKKRKKRGS